MTLRNAFKPHRLAFTTALVLAPFGAFAAGLDVYRTSQEHSLEVRATLTNATREYWDYPGFVHDETDSHRRRFRLIQSNEDPGLDPVAGWTSNITLKAAVEAEGNSVSTEPLANMTTEISNSVISHRTELSYDWQRDTEWVDSVYASARSEFLRLLESVRRKMSSLKCLQSVNTAFQPFRPVSGARMMDCGCGQ